MMVNNCTPISKQHLYGNLANFETEKQIGQGQFSQVFKAKCLIDNKVVALKRMKVVFENKIYTLLFGKVKKKSFYFRIET
jgi:serine/threonine protein kinase